MSRMPDDQMYSRLEKIEQLDPIEDYIAVTQLFYQDFQNAIWLQVPESLMYAFSVPSVAVILHRTEEFEKNFRKRAVDQALLAAAMFQQGYGPGPGRDALRRMNGNHRRYPILKEDFEMQGCLTVVSPVRLAERFGWREVTEKEKTALAHSSQLLVRHMGLDDIPDSFEGQADCLERHLATRVARSENTVPLGNATIDYFVSIEDEPLRSVTSAILRGVVDARVVRALGLDVPHPEVVELMSAYVRGVASLDPVTDDTYPSFMKEILAEYPNGFQIKDLGVHRDDAEASYVPA